MKMIKKSSNECLLALMLILFALCSGCVALKKMPIKADTNELDLKQHSIVLFSMKTSNELCPEYQPDVKSVVFENEKGAKLAYKVDGYYDFEDNKWYFYLISADLNPGAYKITFITGVSKSLLIIGSFRFSINVEFEIGNNEVVYIGSIEMNNRQIRDGEKRSGSVIPLIDQNVTGYSNGTFDVKLTDNSEYDLKCFRREYDILNSVEIKTRIGRTLGAQS